MLLAPIKLQYVHFTDQITAGGFVAYTNQIMALRLDAFRMSTN